MRLLLALHEICIYSLSWYILEKTTHCNATELSRRDLGLFLYSFASSVIILTFINQDLYCLSFDLFFEFKNYLIITTDNQELVS